MVSRSQIGVSRRQLLAQPSWPIGSPRSHSSPLTVSSSRLPHISVEPQSAEQPSSLVLFPSSHASGLSRSWLPHSLGTQRAVRHAPGAGATILRATAQCQLRRVDADVDRFTGTSGRCNAPRACGAHRTVLAEHGPRGHTPGCERSDDQQQLHRYGPNTRPDTPSGTSTRSRSRGSLPSG
jgi:hypothetical protein